MDQYKTRSDTPEQYKWNLNLIYQNADLWDADFKKIDAAAQAMQKFKGRLASNVDDLYQAFEVQTELDLLIERLYAYAHHLSDEDTRDTTNLGRTDRIRSKAAEVGAKLSWMDPELLEAPLETLQAFRKAPALKKYARRLEHLIRSKPHQRNAEVEEILSLASEPLGAAYKVYSLLENADMKVPNAKDKDGD